MKFGVNRPKKAEHVEYSGNRKISGRCSALFLYMLLELLLRLYWIKR
jgi:hypothetical protein